MLLLMLVLMMMLRPVPAQQGRPTVCPYPVTYQMNRSTIIMPCNETGLTDPQSTRGWGIVDFDWSNAKAVWAQAQPMNCEEMLVEQVTRTTAASPGTTVWVYRNGIKALPWYTLVRDKVTDPDYGPWFLPFSDAVIANHSLAHVPVCDTNYQPPRCSRLYHDQTQTPGYPTGDGVCAAPGCDVGSVPVGEYLFDFRAANVSIHGQTMLDWYIEDYLFGPTGAGNPHVSGFYFDDDWSQCAQQRRVCPSEMSHHAVDDMGLSASDLQDILSSFTEVMDKAYATIVERGKFSWNQLWNADKSCCIDCPDPLVKNETCAADVRSLCRADSYAQKFATVYGFSPGCGGNTTGLPPHSMTLDIAAFLLTRGPHAWLGHGWSGCSRTYEWAPELDGDYGEPLGLCTETSARSGVFTREWTKSTVTLDCNTWNSTIVFKAAAALGEKAY
jgi:hypothetical protein